jgi:hypothetical protein
MNRTCKTFLKFNRYFSMHHFYPFSVNKFFLFVMVLFIASSGILLSQEQKEIPETDRKGVDPEEIMSYLESGKMRMNIEFGSMFMYSRGFGSGFGTFISPGISYPVGSRFSLHSGLKVNMFSHVTAGNFENAGLPGFTSTLIYAGGSYKLSERVSISGTGFKEISSFSTVQASSFFQPSNYKGLMMGVDWKLGENFFIQGQIEISNGASPFWFHPMNQPAFPRNHPFGRPGLR